VRNAVLNEGRYRQRILGFNMRSRALRSSATAMRDSLSGADREDGISLPDPVAMERCLDATIGRDWSPSLRDVETQSELTRGDDVVDRLNVAARRAESPVGTRLQTEAKVNVWLEPSTRSLEAALFEACSRLRRNTTTGASTRAIECDKSFDVTAALALSRESGFKYPT